MSVAAAFEHQAKACIALGSPFMGQLCGLFATRKWPASALTDRVFAWSGDIGPSGDSVPLRLCGGLHALALQGDAGLGAVYPPLAVTDDDLWAAVCDAMMREQAFLDAWIDTAPQTNEVRRSVVLIAAGHVIADHFGLPIETSELGASGGLNLNWDQYGFDIDGVKYGNLEPILTFLPEWSGYTPPTAPPMLRRKSGVDLYPLEPKKDALRLRAFLWADQADRLTLTNAAIAAADTAVDQGDAIEWLATQLTPRKDAVHMVYHTVAWQYFPAEQQAKGAALIEAAGARATADAPLAWFGMENDGGNGAALTLRLWPGDVRLELGRADFHGRWVDWTYKA